MNPVLVVDDDESYRELVMVTLEDQCGVPQVLGFGSGGPLLRHLASEGGTLPALAIVDLHMPDMSGLELLRALHRVAPKLPVAILSGAADDDEREAGLAAGACAFLRKPIAYPELIRLLQGLVRSVHAGDATTN
jgi:CheY-like chemotaxis protein